MNGVRGNGLFGHSHGVVDMSTRYTKQGPNSGKFKWPTDGDEVYGPIRRLSCWKIMMEESIQETISRIRPIVYVGQILDAHDKMI
jgi:hypothetical protein